MLKFKPLPFDKKSLEPFLSEETVFFHYEKHHRGYFDKVVVLTSDLPQEEGERLSNEITLESLIFRSYKNPDLVTLYNNASQVWNHDFYWSNLISHSQQVSLSFTEDCSLSMQIIKQYSTLDNLKLSMEEEALKLMGSGYVWLFKDLDAKLKIIVSSNAECGLTFPGKPLLTIDLWEHSYYIDTRNSRAQYLKNIWNIVNWTKVAENYLENISA